MIQTNQTAIQRFMKTAVKGIAAATFAVIVGVIPTAVYADNTALFTQNFNDPNWQATHNSDNWNHTHNWAYHAPQYQFESTFPVEQWGRSTSVNAASQHPQNVRRDRHAAFLPPSHGSATGFYSGEFPTSQVNPFAPRFNNNPNAAYAVAVESPLFAVQPGEAGVNVAAVGTQSGGFLASTSVTAVAPHENIPPSFEPQGGFTVTHNPIIWDEEIPTGAQTSTQTGTQADTWNARITTVEPFEDGTIGRIFIPALNNRFAAVRSGVALSTLDNYVGHFPQTSQWDGNIALASHNRGRGSFFAGIWTLQYGDRIFYETTLGMRVYEVVSITQIHETDLSVLAHSHENILSLITCVYGQSTARWLVRAVEVG